MCVYNLRETLTPSLLRRVVAEGPAPQPPTAGGWVAQPPNPHRAAPYSSLTRARKLLTLSSEYLLQITK
jgi:hypothetical protein